MPRQPELAPRDALYLKIEDLLDVYRRSGVSELDVRFAIERAWRGSTTISRLSEQWGSPRRR